MIYEPSDTRAKRWKIREQARGNERQIDWSVRRKSIVRFQLSDEIETKNVPFRSEWIQSNCALCIRWFLHALHTLFGWTGQQLFVFESILLCEIENFGETNIISYMFRTCVQCVNNQQFSVKTHAENQVHSHKPEWERWNNLNWAMLLQGTTGTVIDHKIIRSIICNFISFPWLSAYTLHSDLIFSVFLLIFFLHVFLCFIPFCIFVLLLLARLLVALE